MVEAIRRGGEDRIIRASACEKITDVCERHGWKEVGFAFLDPGWLGWGRQKAHGKTLAGTPGVWLARAERKLNEHGGGSIAAALVGKFEMMRQASARIDCVLWTSARSHRSQYE